jgi:hypothetical protein
MILLYYRITGTNLEEAEKEFKEKFPKQEITTESNEGNTSTNKYIQTVSYLSIGSFLIVVAILLGMKKKGMHIEYQDVMIEFINHVGIALLLIGIVSIIVEMDHWLHYFRRRVADVIVGHEHLNTLHKQELISIQTQVLKAYFKNTTLSDEGGLFKYYQNNLQHLIDDPYREKFASYFHVFYFESTRTMLKVEHTLSWTCKANKGLIQPTISYILNDPHISNFNVIQIVGDHPEYPFEFNNVNHFPMADKFPNRFRIHKHRNLIHGIDLLLTKEERQADGMNVKIKVEYTIPMGGLLGSKMILPTHNAEITIKFPEDLECIYETFLTDGEKGKKFPDPFKCPGLVKFDTQGWVLPNEGVALQLLPRIILPVDDVSNQNATENPIGSNSNSTDDPPNLGE